MQLHQIPWQAAHNLCSDQASTAPAALPKARQCVQPASTPSHAVAAPTAPRPSAPGLSTIPGSICSKWPGSSTGLRMAATTLTFALCGCFHPQVCPEWLAGVILGGASRRAPLACTNARMHRCTHTMLGRALLGGHHWHALTHTCTDVRTRCLAARF